MRILVVSLACAVASGCTASRVATRPVAAAACVDEGEVAPAPVDEATRNYQTAYSVCHSDPAFAASLYQRVVEQADPQSDLYSRASGRLDALQSAIADRQHPEAARAACDQAAKWARPTERVAVVEEAAPAPRMVVPVPPTPSGPLPASWLPAASVEGGGDGASQRAARGSCVATPDALATSSNATSHAGAGLGACSGSSVAQVTSAGSAVSAGRGTSGSCGSAVCATMGLNGGAVATNGSLGLATSGDSAACASTGLNASTLATNGPVGLATSGGSAACASTGLNGGAASTNASIDLTGSGRGGAVAGEWAPFEPSATVAVEAAAPEFLAPPLVAVTEAPLPAPPLVVASAPALSPPPMVGSVVYVRPQYVPVRVPGQVVVTRRDPGAEFLGALFSVFGSQPVRVAPQRTQRH